MRVNGIGLADSLALRVMTAKLQSLCTPIDFFAAHKWLLGGNLNILQWLDEKIPTVCLDAQIETQRRIERALHG